MLIICPYWPLGRRYEESTLALYGSRSRKSIRENLIYEREDPDSPMPVDLFNQGFFGAFSLNYGMTFCSGLEIELETILIDLCGD